MRDFDEQRQGTLDLSMHPSLPGTKPKQYPRLVNTSLKLQVLGRGSATRARWVPEPTAASGTTSVGALPRLGS